MLLRKMPNFRHTENVVNCRHLFDSGSIRCVTGEGMPRHRNPFEKGNLYVKFEIAFPPNQFIEPDKLKASSCQLIVYMATYNIKTY